MTYSPYYLCRNSICLPQQIKILLGNLLLRNQLRSKRIFDVLPKKSSIMKSRKKRIGPFEHIIIFCNEYVRDHYCGTYSIVTSSSKSSKISGMRFDLKGHTIFPEFQAIFTYTNTIKKRFVGFSERSAYCTALASRNDSSQFLQMYNTAPYGAIKLFYFQLRVAQKSDNLVRYETHTHAQQLLYLVCIIYIVFNTVEMYAATLLLLFHITPQFMSSKSKMKKLADNSSYRTQCYWSFTTLSERMTHYRTSILLIISIA